MKLDRILVPTDFSDCAEPALDRAIYLARLFGAELHLLHVQLLHSSYPPSVEQLLPEIADIQEREDRFASQELQRLCDEKNVGEIELHRAVRRAIAAPPAIVEYAESEGIDLIVLGTHGRRGLRRLLLGSVAEEVVRTASCPVMAVRGSEADSMEPFRRIAVAFDFSPHSEWALDQARSLAAACGARLDLLHVVPLPVSPGTLGGIPLPAASIRDTAEIMTEKLGEVAAGRTSREAPITAHVLEGLESWEITDFAKSEGSDLVVLGSHGLSGLPRFLLGSVSEKVVRSAPCSVVVFHRPEND